MSTTDLGEQRRLQGIVALEALRPGGEATLARIVRLATALTGAPSAAIHVIDHDTQHRVAAVNAPLEGWPRHDSLCRHVVESGEGIVTADATTEARFAGSSFVEGDTPVRFYASAPLETELYGVLGTVCAWDTEVHSDPSGSLERLADLADMVVEHLQSERVLRILAEEASTDELTGLPNRRSVYDVLGRALGRLRRDGVPVAVAYLDLDGFKGVNDTHGHDAGDRLLQHVAAGLRAAVREGELAGRLGGDEFVVVGGADLARPEAAARLAAAVTTPVRLADGTEVAVGCSVGVAVGDPEDTADALMQRADGAMFTTKRARGAAR